MSATPFTLTRVYPYRITEAAGSVDWGLWFAASAADALALLHAAVAANPDAYCGTPAGAVATREVL